MSSKSKETPQQTCSLESLPRDVHRIILLYLADSSPSAVLNVARCSKILHDASVPFVHRSLVLSKGTSRSKKLSAYKTIVNKFRDPASDIVKYARHIIVESKIPRKDLLMIIESIAKGGRLARLEWKIAAHMPSEIFQKIHSTWPNLELSVTLEDRRKVESAAERQMDIALLSSPLLTELTYTVYYKGWSCDRPVKSEWPRLTQVLNRGGNIRSLQLTAQPDYHPQIVDDNEPEKIPRLDLLPGTRLSKLEELSIKADCYPYLWDKSHCSALHDAIDITRIRKLDFGDNNPEDFFTFFKDLMPNLRSLGFGLKRGSVKPARNFITSLTGLESLSIMAVQNGIPGLWPAINCHKETLKRLIFGPRVYPGSENYGYGPPEFMNVRTLSSVPGKFPRLEHLGWPVPCEQSIDEKHISILSTMNLKKIDIFTHLPCNPCDYAGDLTSSNMGMGAMSIPNLDKRKSVATATKIAVSISQEQKEPLECLTMHFSRSAPGDRGDPYTKYAEFQLGKNERLDDTGEINYHVVKWDDFNY